MEGLASENDIYRWESGKHKPQDDTLSAIAKALGRDYAWAVGLSPLGATPDLSGAVSEESQLSRIESTLEIILGVLERQVGADILEAVRQDMQQAPSLAASARPSQAA